MSGQTSEHKPERYLAKLVAHGYLHEYLNPGLADSIYADYIKDHPFPDPNLPIKGIGKKSIDL